MNSFPVNQQVEGSKDYLGFGLKCLKEYLDREKGTLNVLESDVKQVPDCILMLSEDSFSDVTGEIYTNTSESIKEVMMPFETFNADNLTVSSMDYYFYKC